MRTSREKDREICNGENIEVRGHRKIDKNMETGILRNRPKNMETETLMVQPAPRQKK